MVARIWNDQLAGKDGQQLKMTTIIIIKKKNVSITHNNTALEQQNVSPWKRILIHKTVFVSTNARLLSL